MPYKSSGKTVYVKKGGRWIKKATASSVEKAQAMVRLLRGMKKGMKPRNKK